MSKPSKSWQHRDEDYAWCDRCGAKSEYRFMSWWRSTQNHSAHFTYWRWWDGFKRAHRRCGNLKMNQVKINYV